MVIFFPPYCNMILGRVECFMSDLHTQLVVTPTPHPTPTLTPTPNVCHTMARCLSASPVALC